MFGLLRVILKREKIGFWRGGGWGVGWTFGSGLFLKHLIETG